MIFQGARLYSYRSGIKAPSPCSNQHQLAGINLRRKLKLNFYSHFAIQDAVRHNPLLRPGLLHGDIPGCSSPAPGWCPDRGHLRVREEFG